MDNYNIMLSLLVGSDAFNLITIGGMGEFHLRDWSCVSCVRLYPQPTRVQDLSAVNVTSQSQADRMNRNAYRYSVVMLVLFICK